MLEQIPFTNRQLGLIIGFAGLTVGVAGGGALAAGALGLSAEWAFIAGFAANIALDNFAAIASTGDDEEDAELAGGAA